jgi:transposase-like protein
MRSISILTWLRSCRRRSGPSCFPSMSEHDCPRCKTATLAETGHAENIRFFLCSSCNRRYALQAGKTLTSRWHEAVTLPLYDVCSSDAPVQDALKVARRFVSHSSTELLDWMLREIRLELDDPTQQVRDTLDCKAPEAELRQFLASFCEHVERLRAMS